MNFDLLTRLSEAPGVSGDEKAVRKLIAEAVRERVDGLRADSMGSLIAFKAASGSAGRAEPLPSPDDPADHRNGPGDDNRPFRVMLAAHMDEVGLMVTEINDDGSLSFDVVGGVDARVLPSQPVRVGADAVPGVIGFKPPHLSKASERDHVPEVKSLRIDIGADGKDAAGKLVKRGSYAVFATEVTDLGPTLLGKAFDDRGGCAMLVELLADRYPFDLYGVFTVQEEVGLRGARVAAHQVNPHAAFVLECGTTDDTPKKRDDTPVMRLGQGPAITVVDRSMVADARLVRHLVATAEAEGIPYQIRAPKGGGTDGGRIHLAREGVPTAVVSLPCRYLHAPASLISKSDFQHTVALLRAALHRLTPDVLAR